MKYCQALWEMERIRDRNKALHFLVAKYSCVWSLFLFLISSSFTFLYNSYLCLLYLSPKEVLNLLLVHYKYQSNSPLQTAYSIWMDWSEVRPGLSIHPPSNQLWTKEDHLVYSRWKTWDRLSSAMKMKVKLKSLCRVRLFVTLWTVAH